MRDIRRAAIGFGLSLLVLLGFGLSGVASAQKYIPDGPDVPTIALNEDQSGAAGLPPLPVPPPKGWDQQSIWNMKMVGFQDNQGRASSDDGWIENQNGRYILYMANSPGKELNPLTGKVENNGTSLIDVTDPAHPEFLYHIPTESGGGATHVAVCGGNTLPHAEKNHWYLLRHDGSTNQEIWDVTDPSAPTQAYRRHRRFDRQSTMIGGNAIPGSPIRSRRPRPTDGRKAARNSTSTSTI